MKKKIIIIIICFIVLFCSILSINLFRKKVILEVDNLDDISLLLGENYKEDGATAELCNAFKCVDYSNEVLITNDIDVNKIGIYEVKYEVGYKKQKIIKTKNVTIVDNQKPLITLNGKDSVLICPNKKYEEEGYVAVDNYDGDITRNVLVTEFENYYEYKVKDSSNNEDVVIRKILYEDKEKPVIKLKGSNNMIVSLGTNYVEPGYVVEDNCSINLEGKVKIIGNVDTTKEGNYTLTYIVNDDNGNETNIKRTVKVVDKGTFNTLDKNEYIKALENYISEKKYNVSIGYVNLQTNYQYLYKEDTVYYGASLVKTVDALYAYEKMELTDSIINNVKKAITISDNSAHKNLVNQIGINNLRSYGRSLGASKFLTRGNSDYYGNTTVKDQIAIWKYLYKYINSANNGQELKSYFMNSFYNSIKFDGIPSHMHKYGWYGNYYHDVGIVFSDSPYIVVILTKHGKGNYSSIVSDLSKKIYGLNKIDG